ncbi:MAG TPA: HAD family hydrolase [Kouleothrix sp.]|uniref:HAD family hydrolase n=1 Tax=Kouleothrix sp. TaxID=2779161 RepID=UPI002C0A47EC|nr:HAD family hydrolase [Kouleothrix sp.]
MPRFDIIAFDADDTLWHCERLYVEAQAQLRQQLAHYHSPDWIDERLFQTEMRNLQHFGYGVKAFALSMIETAVELTEGRVTGREIQAIIDSARAMLSADVELLEHVADTLAHLAGAYTLMLITKGDLRDQEQKIARSGLAGHFRAVEIVSDKRQEIYAALLQRHRVAPERFLMVGNSLRSDILPVLALGASAVYVPHEYTWAHEAADLPLASQPGFYEIAHLGILPGLIASLEAG